MIFEIERVSKSLNKPYIREFNTLEELADFAKSIDERLIITFPYVNAYRHGEDESHGSIIIYDDYIG
jgi:hypothetical protein